MVLARTDQAVVLAICALSLIWAPAAGAAILLSPQVNRKPQPRLEPAPANSDHYAEPVESPPTWKI